MAATLSASRGHRSLCGGDGDRACSPERDGASQERGEIPVSRGKMWDLCPSRPAVPAGTAVQGSGKAARLPRAVPSVEVIPG